MANIGERIKQVRKDAKLSQVDFAKTLEVTQGFLSGLEKGRYQPTAEFLIRVTTIYQVDANWLLSEEDNNVGSEKSVTQIANKNGAIQVGGKVHIGGDSNIQIGNRSARGPKISSKSTNQKDLVTIDKVIEVLEDYVAPKVIQEIRTRLTD